MDYYRLISSISSFVIIYLTDLTLYICITAVLETTSLINLKLISVWC